MNKCKLLCKLCSLIAYILMPDCAIILNDPLSVVYSFFICVTSEFLYRKTYLLVFHKSNKAGLKYKTSMYELDEGIQTCPTSMQFE